MSDRPVVVLMDEGSFSATDIFLGAMSLAPNVTLMGVPSGGGSGRSRGFDLPNSRLRVILSTMASFRPDGHLYDGVGIAPDVMAPRTLDGVANGRDTQMAEALRFLRQRISPSR
jgi:C-terminal processing protease CtpA/Prc